MSKIKFCEMPGNPDETIYVKFDNDSQLAYNKLLKKLKKSSKEEVLIFQQGYCETEILFVLKNILLKNNIKYNLSFDKKRLEFIYSFDNVKIFKLIEKEFHKTGFKTKIIFKDELGYEFTEFKKYIKKLKKEFRELEIHGCMSSGQILFNGFIKNFILFDPEKYCFSFDKEVLTIYGEKDKMLDLIKLAKHFTIGLADSRKKIKKTYLNIIN